MCKKLLSLMLAIVLFVGTVSVSVPVYATGADSKVEIVTQPESTVVSKGERDCSCPLVAVPEKIHSDEAIAAYSTGYIDGWNGCLEKMQG